MTTATATNPTPAGTAPAPAPSADHPKAKRPSTERLDAVQCAIAVLTQIAHTFVDPAGICYVRLPQQNECGRLSGRVVRLDSDTTRHWVSHTVWEMYNLPLNRQGADAALSIVAGQTEQTGPVHRIHTRIAPDEGGDGLWLDLGDEHHRAVHVTRDGWETVGLDKTRDAPYFQRPEGYQALPIPKEGGTLAELRPFLNLGTGTKAETRFRLMVGWLLGVFMPRGDFPHLILNGPKGSGKTRAMGYLRGLVDPNLALENPEPDSEEEMRLQAQQAHVVSFDNIGSISKWQSNALCRLSTGSASAKRKLYTDDTRLVMRVKRPVILNGIGEMARADDLLQRSIRVTLKAMPPGMRRRETELDRAYTAARPRLLGALLDAVVVALREQETVADALTDLPRLADFYVWVLAAERSGTLGWPVGGFADAYAANLKDSRQTALDANPVTYALLALMRHDLKPTDRMKGDLSGDIWTGTMDDLLHDVGDCAKQRADLRNHYTGWPATLQAFKAKLNAAEDDLAAVGLTIARPRTKTARRLVVTYQPCQAGDDDEVTSDDEPPQAPRHPFSPGSMGAPAIGDEGDELLVTLEREEEEREYERECSFTSSPRHPGATNPHVTCAEAVNEPPAAPRHHLVTSSPDGQPPLTGWALALSLVPTCPNPNHVHSGFRCARSKLPLRYDRWDRLERQPFELLYGADGQPCDVKRTIEPGAAMWQDEAVAAYLRDVEHIELPADNLMRRKLEKVEADWRAEQAKLDCPHLRPTHEPGRSNRRVLTTRCPDCGADLTSGVPL